MEKPEVDSIERIPVLEEDDDATERRSLMFFGRDLAMVPCFRSSFLYGISAGLCVGLISFLATSRGKRSLDFGMYSFCATTLCYWCGCRYSYSKKHFELLQLQDNIKLRQLYEGTEREKEFEHLIDMKTV